MSYINAMEIIGSTQNRNIYHYIKYNQLYRYLVALNVLRAVK